MIIIKPIRIFTPELQLLAEIDNYESLIFTRNYHKSASFQLTINVNKRGTDKLQKDNLVVLSPKKVGIIEYRGFKVDESGKGGETLLIIGYSLSGITKDRLTEPPPDRAYDRINAPAETVMKHYINNNCISPVNPDRAFNMLINAPDQARGPQLVVQSRLKNLEKELEGTSIVTGLGWLIGVDLTLMKWVFDVYQGRDLTSGNTAGNNPVIFSTDFDNIKGQSYVDSDINTKTVAYVGGQGEGAEREIVQVGNASGLQRKEVFVDARDIGEGSEDPPPASEEITARLISRGEQKLAELQPIRTFEAEILTYGPFKYEEDWDLGDEVTVQNRKWRVVMDSRITEVKEIYEPTGFKLEAVFGNDVPTLIDKLKSELGQFGNEITK